MILKKVLLKSNNLSTNKAVHFSNGSLIDKPNELRILKYEDDEGFYLLYINASGEELTDTFHDTLQQAIEQAEWEFNVKYEDWEDYLP